MLRIKAIDGAGEDPSTGKYIFVERLAPQISTYMRPYWFNAVQEEIANTIEADGTVLDDNNNRQLLRAIKFPHAIRSNLTLTYGTDFTNLNQAFEALRGRYIAPGVTVTISLGSGYLHTINVPSQVVIDHPQGSQIQIIGDVANPSNVVIRHITTDLPGFGGAIEIAEGCSIGLMDGFTMSETYVSHPDPRYYVKLRPHSSAKFGSNVVMTEIAGSAIMVTAFARCETGAMTIRNFAQMFGVSSEITGVGIQVLNKGFLFATGIKMTNALDLGLHGILAKYGSEVRLASGDFSNSPVSIDEGSSAYITNTNSYGTLTGKNAFNVGYGSNVHFNLCNAGGSGKAVDLYGFYVKGGYVRADGCTASYCNMGFMVEAASRVSLNSSCNSSNNVNYGYYLINYSYVGDNANGTSNGVARAQKDTSSIVIPAIGA